MVTVLLLSEGLVLEGEDVALATNEDGECMRGRKGRRELFLLRWQRSGPEMSRGVHFLPRHPPRPEQGSAVNHDDEPSKMTSDQTSVR